jgi:hypothetical protein
MSTGRKRSQSKKTNSFFAAKNAKGREEEKKRIERCKFCYEPDLMVKYISVKLEKLPRRLKDTKE